MSYTPPTGGSPNPDPLPSGQTNPQDPYGALRGGPSQGSPAPDGAQAGSAQAAPASSADGGGTSGGGHFPQTGAPVPSGYQAAPYPGAPAQGGTGYGAMPAVNAPTLPAVRTAAAPQNASPTTKAAGTIAGIAIAVVLIGLVAFAIYRVALVASPPDDPAPGYSSTSASQDEDPMEADLPVAKAHIAVDDVREGPEDINGRSTVVFTLTATNNSDAPLLKVDLLPEVTQNGADRSLTDYPKGGEPEGFDPNGIFGEIRPGATETWTVAYEVSNRTDLTVQVRDSDWSASGLPEWILSFP